MTGYTVPCLSDLPLTGRTGKTAKGAHKEVERLSRVVKTIMHTKSTIASLR